MLLQIFFDIHGIFIRQCIKTKELRMHAFRVLIKSVVDSFCFQSYGDQSQKMTSTVWQGT